MYYPHDSENVVHWIVLSKVFYCHGHNFIFCIGVYIIEWQLLCHNIGHCIVTTHLPQRLGGGGGEKHAICFVSANSILTGRLWSNSMLRLEDIYEPMSVCPQDALNFSSYIQTCTYLYDDKYLQETNMGKYCRYTTLSWVSYGCGAHEVCLLLSH